ncbi:MAG: hypothetical protein QOE54_1611 [Streptosporangiaceae bacterium]|nr:hypothetical protein [Streptosporangiaceae bacterium]
MKGRAPRVTVAVLAIVLALVGCGGKTAHKPKITSTVRSGLAPTPPARDGAYFGALVDPANKQSLTGFERFLGRQVDIVHAYRSWDQPFPQDGDAAVLAGGRYLMLSWNGVDTTAITSGEQDKSIHQRAKAIKKIGKPILLRWQPDMDKPGLTSTVHSAVGYVAAWKHLREIFHAEHVDNAAWAWCPTAQGFGDNAADYYPGDDQVDWLCADAYPAAKTEYQDLSQVLKPFLSWAAARPRPIMIGEFGVPRSYGPRRAEWLRKAAQTLQNPQIKAVLYFDSDARGHGSDKRLQYSLAGDDAAMSAIRELATSPFFNPRNVPVQSN